MLDLIADAAHFFLSQCVGPKRLSVGDDRPKFGGDVNEAMIKETTCYLEDHGQKNFSTHCGGILVIE